jgi:hypothetical protein
MWLIALIGVLSLAVLALALMMWRQMRLERQRSEARIAALATAMDDPRWAMPLESDSHADDLPSPVPLVSLVAPEVRRTSRAPAFAAAAVVVLCTIALLGVAMNGARRTPRHAQPAAAAAASIELVSMHHALDGETLIVSGLVRNPSTTETPALSATISVLGRDGQVLARGESRLDAEVLGPGRETTFRVSVPDVSDPGRYRVAFMNGSQIVPHVDRRSDLARAALANDDRGN